MARTSLHLLLLTGVTSLVMFINLGGPQLWDRDEPRNAACAREMLERDDWVVPTFNAELRVLKPALKYWLMIAAYKMFGINEFAARFFSAVFALATVWVTYFLGRRLFNARAGLWSALILATSLLFAVAGHAAKADAPLTFFSALALLVFAYSAFRPAEAGAALVPAFQGSWLVWAGVYASIAFAALAKGLVGLLMPAAVIGLFLLIVYLPNATALEGQSWWRRCLGLLRPFAPGHFLRTFWLMRPITGIVVALAIAGPWYVLVGIRTDGEFLRGFFLDHHLGRALQPLENHSGPFLLYYLGTIAGGFLPWSVFLPAVLAWLVTQLRSARPASILLACWVGVYVVIFSLAQTKLPSYITPCFPALALLMGGFLQQWTAGLALTSRFWMRLGWVVLGVLGIGMAAGLVVAARIYFPGEELLGLIGVILAAAAVAGFILVERQRRFAAGISMVLAAVAFITTLFGVVVERVSRQPGQQSICSMIRAQGSASPVGFLCGLEPSWVFYSGRPIQPLCMNAAGARQSHDWKVTPVLAAEYYARDRDCLILTDDNEWQWLRPALPADAQILAECPRFLRKGRMLLIGRPPAQTTSRR